MQVLWLFLHRHPKVRQCDGRATSTSFKTLYLEGLGFRSIGRILGFSHVAVYQWIRAFGERIMQLKASSAQIVEMDEMHSYVGHKKTIAGTGLLLIDLENAFCMLSLAPEVLSPGGNFGST